MKCTSIIWKCIKGIQISVYWPRERNIMLTNSPSIKMTSGKHGKLFKVSFVRIKWNRNIRAFFTDKGQQITGDKNIADKFNEYFTQIGTSLANSIDIAVNATFDTYLKKPNSSSIQFQYTDAPSVQNIINNLKPKSSAGHDNISSKLLRQIGDIVAYPLSIIVKQSLCTGIFPHRIKLAKVMPLYKKYDNKLSGNYRPISLLSSISKVFEKIVFDQLYDYLITNGLLFVSQYGFRKQRSTKLAALELTDRIRREMDQDKIPFSVFLDL